MLKYICSLAFFERVFFVSHLIHEDCFVRTFSVYTLFISGTDCSKVCEYLKKCYDARFSGILFTYCIQYL